MKDCDCVWFGIELDYFRRFGEKEGGNDTARTGQMKGIILDKLLSHSQQDAIQGRCACMNFKIES